MADCVSNKIDSNVTGLAFAEEVCARQLPTVADDGHDPTWYDLEPNSYDDFGGDIKTLARKPLNKNRRNKKGTTVDLDAAAKFNQDLTLHNSNRLMQGFFFSNFREKPTTKPYNDDQVVITGITATDDRYAAAAGMLRFSLSGLVLVKGAATPANNGLKLVDERTDTYIGVGDGTVDETPDDGLIITQVGYQFDADEASIVMAGDIPVLTLATPPVAAACQLTIASAQNAVAAETVTIGDVTYTWRVAPTEPYEVLIGGSRVASAVNLRKAINGDLLGTPAHPIFSAADNGAGVVTITALAAGTDGNGYDTSETMTQGSWNHAATQGGTGVSFDMLKIDTGSWVFLGGDEDGTSFDTNKGYARVADKTDTELTFDKTTWTPEDETIVSGGTLQIFYGAELRDEDYDQRAVHYFQFERTLGEDADGTQAQYLRGGFADEATFNIGLANKVNVDFGFLCADEQLRKGIVGLKTGSRVAAPGEDAFNTSNDVVRMALGVIDDTTSVPTGLFAWATEAKLVINNNAKAVKAIGALGGIDVNVGNFDVSGTATALFTTVDAIAAIQNNDDVTLDVICAKLNTGFIFDIPLLSLGGGRPDIKENEPVMLPLTLNGAENPNSYTMMYALFEYLPTLAMPVAEDVE